ncbi:uncharacterized protein LOC131179463 [Hevea brasiliensis]|uniref:uncharacterized protein LOC131179463 n=1 Tax=Hevea brasiliensis TaxID=3981 RepID=UPI0025E8967A|nr:uncharacterized protein LOC131179463 [Hevea brasiliensis]
MDQLATHNKMFKNKVTQEVSSLSKAIGKLPSQLEMNPKEQYKAVALKSGKILEDHKPKAKQKTIDETSSETDTQVKGEEIHANKEALSQMSSYAKSLKEILSNKRKLNDYDTVALTKDLNDYEIVALTKECNAVLQNKLPVKLKDLGSFSIPCLIGNMNIDKVLSDLGASVSIMPLSICQKRNVGELKPTIISF